MRINPIDPKYRNRRSKCRAKPPTLKQRARWNKICALGCSVKGCLCTPEIHHCETGRGGRKDHDKVIGLCDDHHTGHLGIHTLSRRVWQRRFGTEQEHMAKLDRLLQE